ncbi:MAG: DUF928 domain-containing protein [Leptolyngbyaceae cyanobacterium RU_5_1]|nr:DUF928 domain-containing protein [Leptolyngbyaceae cyanobacterium RU_5_1]
MSMLSAIALSLSSTVQTTWSQVPAIDSEVQSTEIIFNPPTAAKQGAPRGRKRGGASRGPCRQFESLAALAPTQDGIVWGQTVSDRPTFWFYLPSPLTDKTPIEFMLQDAAGNEVYSTRLTIPNTKSGLIHLSLPATAKPLQIGQSYVWAFSVDCDPSRPSISVTGNIQRVALDAAVQRRLQGAPSLEHAKVYAANGIWYEALNTLADLHRGNPNQRQLAAAWTSLLQQVDLKSLAPVPFVPCCTPASESPKRQK